MLLSKKKKFIFYHVYKVAGTSIRYVLAKHCSKKQIAFQALDYSASLIGAELKLPPIYKYHPNLSEIRQYMGDDFYNYYRFSFVRNPLDWQKSLYFFSLKNPRHHQHTKLKDMTFDEYIQWRIEYDCKLQSDLIYHNGELLVDDVFRYENIDSDFKRLCNNIGIKARLPHKNKAGNDKEAVLSENTLKRFKVAFQNDYNLLGYDE